MRTAVGFFALSLILQLIGCQVVAAFWAFGSIEAETAIAWLVQFLAIPVGCFFAMLAVIKVEVWSARNDRRLGSE